MSAIILAASMLAAMPTLFVRAAVNDGDEPPTAPCSCVCVETAANVEVVGPDIVDADGEQASAPVTVDAAPTDVPTPPITARPGIVFSELLPDPVGKDADGEFIELRNEGVFDADLTGWIVASETGRVYLIPGIVVAAGAYVHFPYSETKLGLTNSGAKLTLSDATGAEVDVVGYTGTVKEGQAYAKNDAGTWSWTPVATPGSVNVFPLPAIVPPTEAGATDSSSAASEPPAGDHDVAAAPSAAVAVDAAAATMVGLSEFMPDPAGTDDGEWIEIGNDGDGDASLAGWTLDDAVGGSEPFVLTVTDIVPAHGWLVLPKSRTGLALNNDGDSVRLFDTAGLAVEAIRYDRAMEGRSFAKTAAGWAWSDLPTPGAANLREDPPIQAETSGVETADRATLSAEQDASGNGNSAVQADTIVDIAELGEIDDGTVVTVSGIVNIPRGRIGKTLVGLQNEDGTAGIIARYYGTELPATLLGQFWTITGRVSRIGDDIRISTSARNSELVGQRQLAAQPLSIADVTEADAGIYVSVAGLVTKLGRNSPTVGSEDGAGEIRISLPAGGSPATLAEGDPVTAVGTLRYVRGRPELVVTDKNGLEVRARPDKTEPADETNELLNLAASRPPLILTPTAEKPPNYAAYGSIAALSAAAGLALIWWKKRRYSEAAE